ncbi:hypothetical protein [Desulfurobacterium atlanticum]|uniref:Uncharacterized protein n=1 Tax=Desulfurobacterium atlanticum TaxID=240169 RepID=A0A238YCC0_9BACT|nr:hypothetical protein [Desulfurobacterium atlanticum]SNR68926.1 hypothetical protein SAMN06265340_10346 [Desulfurobacterium atlanticum]
MGYRLEKAVIEKKFAGEISKEETEKLLSEIQKELDRMVYELYGIEISNLEVDK